MKIWRTIFLSLFLALSIKAQHAYFSSLNQNLLSVNPAFAGTNKQLRAQVIVGNTGTPKFGYNKQSYYAGIDFLGKKYSGFGLSFSNDNFGPILRRTQADFSYALHFTLKNKIKIIHACQVSYFEYRFDRSKLSFGEYFLNPNDAFVYSWGPDLLAVRHKRNMDFSSGLLAYGKRFYAGVSILSFTQPDEGLMGVSKRPLTQIYQGKYKFLNPESFNFDIYAFTKLQNYYGNFLQYGTYLNYKMLVVHFAHRINNLGDYDAFVSGIALNSNGLRLGYNTKCNYGSNLSNYYFHELYLSFCFGRLKKEEDDTSIKLID
jgi:type IX secretion system PorP/SprF family membrane protein